MDLPIKHEAFAGRGLALRTAGFFKGPRLIIDGGEVKGKRLRFSLRDNSGQERETIALVFVGGGLGALFGLAAVYSSARIFRSDRGTASKYGLSALISLGAALAFFVAALVVQLLIGPRAKT